MGTITPINPQVVYTQNTIPSDLTEGKIWYNTTNNSLYTSNGSAYNLLESDLSSIEQQNLQQNLNILINSVGASTNLNDFDDMFVDIFNDTSGQENTIDIINTTAGFDINNYKNISITEDLTQISSQTEVYSLVKTFSNVDNYINYASNDIWIDGGGVTLYCKYKFIYSDDSNSEVIKTSITSPSEETPDHNTYTNPSPEKEVATIEVYMNSTNDGAIIYELNDIIFSLPSNFIIQSNAKTIEANPTAHQLYVKNSVAGTGNITYDISFDNGVTWILDQPIDTKNSSVHDGTEMIFKINLNGSGAGNTAEAENYGIMLYY